MKTPHKHDRATQRPTTAADRTRAQRTATRFACESLEGRNLMTGFAGAGPMMDHGFADMGGRSGPGVGDFQRFDRPDRFDASGGATVQADATSTGTSAPSSTPVSTNTGTGTDTTAAMAPSGPAGWTPSLAHDGRSDGDRLDGGGSDRSGDRMGGRFDDRGASDMMSADHGGWGDSDEASGGRFDHQRDDFGGDRDVPVAGSSGGAMSPGDAGDAAGTDTGDSTGSTQLQTDMTKLRTDEQSIHDQSQVTPALLAAVRKDQQAIDASQTGTASTTATQQLQTDEQAIFGTTTATSTATTTPATPTTPPTLTDAQKTTLQNDHDAILLSQGVSQTLIDQLAKDRLAVQTASNFTPADQATLDADHKAIQTDFATLHSSASTTPAATSTTAPVAAMPTAPTTAPVAAMPTAPTTTATPSTPTTTTATPSTPTTTATPTDPTSAADAPTMPTEAPTTLMGRSGMNHRRGNLGGSDVHFMHQVSTADDGLGERGEMMGRSGGDGLSTEHFRTSEFGRGRPDFRR